jgi:DNA-binding transcriptional MerR regulator
VSFEKSKREFLQIGELAELTEVSRDTLRHYERKGVLPRPARSAKGYRLYSAKAVERVRLVRRALAVGFTLEELARILAEREQGRLPCRDVHALAVSKLENLDERLREMGMLRGELKTIIGDWDERLAKQSTDTLGHLLETLGHSSESEIYHRIKASAENLLGRKRKVK